MLSVKDKLIMLMGCLGFWLFRWNLICAKYRRTWVFIKINESEKFSEIRYQVNKRKSKYIVTQLRKNLFKVMLAACRRFVMVRSLTIVPAVNKPFDSQPYYKNNLSSSSSSSSIIIINDISFPERLDKSWDSI